MSSKNFIFGCLSETFTCTCFRRLREWQRKSSKTERLAWCCFCSYYPNRQRPTPESSVVSETEVTSPPTSEMADHPAECEKEKHPVADQSEGTLSDTVTDQPRSNTGEMPRSPKKRPASMFSAEERSTTVPFTDESTSIVRLRSTSDPASSLTVGPTPSFTDNLTSTDKSSSSTNQTSSKDNATLVLSVGPEAPLADDPTSSTAGPTPPVEQTFRDDATLPLEVGQTSPFAAERASSTDDGASRLAVELIPPSRDYPNASTEDQINSLSTDDPKALSTDEPTSSDIPTFSSVGTILSHAEQTSTFATAQICPTTTKTQIFASPEVESTCASHPVDGMADAAQNIEGPTFAAPNAKGETSATTISVEKFIQAPQNTEYPMEVSSLGSGQKSTLLSAEESKFDYSPAVESRSDIPPV